MEKVLDTINDESLQKENSFQRKIQLAVEENSILLSQANSYKVYKEKYDTLSEQKDRELEKATEINDNLEGKLL